MAVHLWRRHKKCSHNREQYDREFTTCSCVIQAEGMLPGYAGYRCLSTGTRVMAEADKMRFYAEHCGSWEQAKKAVLAGLPLILSQQHSGLLPSDGVSSVHRERKIVDEAITKFLAELVNPKAKKLNQSTISRYRTVMNRLRAFCADRSLSRLDDITLEHLMDLRDSWPTGPRATTNDINRLRKFYKFCMKFRWVDENLAKRMDCPESDEVQAEPWEPEEFNLIVETAESIVLDAQQAATNEELTVFILVMRHTGLRISDTSLLTEDRVQRDGVVRLRMEKRKNKKGVSSWVTTWLPPEVHERLVRLPLKQGRYFFCHGSTRTATTTDLWRRRINAVLEAAGLRGEEDKGQSTHRFRHTFAVELLKDGESMENVSKLLGHKNIRTTENAYAAWVPARQQSVIEAQRARYAAKQKLAFTVIPGKRAG